ncbi:MAG: hypothetical protein ACKOTF_00270, partial [Opitutaceae bacterium]
MRPRLALVALFAAALLPAAEQKKTNAVRPNPADLPPPVDPSGITAPPGFRVVLLYSVPRLDQGSWVSLTTDPKGRILASDQYGAIYRITPPPIGTSTGTKIEKLNIDLNTVAVTSSAGEPEAKKAKKADSKG